MSEKFFLRNIRRVFFLYSILYYAKLSNRFFVVGSSYKIIDGSIIIISKTDQHFNRDPAGTGFVMRIGTLADMKDFAKLFLGQVRINSEILNTLIFHENTSLVSISIKQTEMCW